MELRRSIWIYFIRIYGVLRCQIIGCLRHETTIVEIAGNVEDIDMVVPYDEWSILQYTYKLSGIAYDHHKNTFRAIIDKP